MPAAMFALFTSLLLPLTSLSAQQPPHVQPGARVRVSEECRKVWNFTRGGSRTNCPKHIGEFESLGVESIVITEEGSGTRLAISVDSVRRFEMSRGRKSNFGKGAGYGCFLGAGGGVAFGLAAAPEGYSVGAALVSGSVFAVVGVVIGGVAGAFIKTDSWEEVTLDRPRVSLAPQRDGRYALGLKVSF